MTEQELREKIIHVLKKNFTDLEVTPVYTREDGVEIELPQELCEIFNDIVTQAVIPYFAEALIAAGIGMFHNFLPVRTFFYTSKKCLSIYFESKEDAKLLEEYLENAPTLDLANYFKHRAEVSEKAFDDIVDEIYRHDVRPICDKEFFKQARFEQAKKELEKKQ